MKATILLGGARRTGNTATACKWVENELVASGHEVETIHLFNENIKGCLACAKCKENPDEVACVQQDDASEILEKMASSDLVIYTSPLYF